MREKKFPNYHSIDILNRKGRTLMDVKLIMIALTGLFIAFSLFFGTKNGFYDSDNYNGNGSAH